MKFQETDRIKLEDMIKKHTATMRIARDDYWLYGHLSQSQLYEILVEEECVGYFSISPKQIITEFYVDWEKYMYPELAFEKICKTYEIKEAYVETYDPLYEMVAMEKAKAVDVIYRVYEGIPDILEVEREDIKIQLATKADLPKLIAFNLRNMGRDKFDFIVWYCTHWIEQKAFYLYMQEGEIVGAGEMRTYKTTPNVVYVGVTVGNDFQNQGLGSFLLADMKKRSFAQNAIPYTCTEPSNVASESAIRRTRYFPVGTIVCVKFCEGLEDRNEVE